MYQSKPREGNFMFYIQVTYKADTEADIRSFVKEVSEAGLLEEIRKEAGNVRYEYFYPAEDSSKLLLLEEWETQEAQQVHMTQPHMEKLGEIKNKYITDTQVKTI